MAGTKIILIGECVSIAGMSSNCVTVNDRWYGCELQSSLRGKAKGIRLSELAVNSTITVKIDSREKRSGMPNIL